MKEEITSAIKNLLLESQREMLNLLRPKTGESVRNSTVDEAEIETRSFHTPTKTVRINSTQNNGNDTNVCRNKYMYIYMYLYILDGNLALCYILL